jgi:phage tail tape-measure protein
VAQRRAPRQHPEDAMFERDEVLQDLDNRLKAAGIDPRDPKVQSICAVVNAFYAEKTREVLERMQAVLNKIET